ncbi:hypothetical protein TL08_01885 [Actinoalloteichus hymeniacidonis]|uniref:Uncharacterized protein n=2 Tax=Actinoalloteichus hymeniacidonis TaxID=340345 RepID=A0AAC9MWN4_9PSEU|nr:hypothetical protein TL08_01885 [Actinoalloteichus hymeniacidonis]
MSLGVIAGLASETASGLAASSGEGDGLPAWMYALIPLGIMVLIAIAARRSAARKRTRRPAKRRPYRDSGPGDSGHTYYGDYERHHESASSDSHSDSGGGWGGGDSGGGGDGGGGGGGD